VVGKDTGVDGKFPAYLGMSIVVPQGDVNGGLVLNRSTDAASMENWENSPELKKFLSESHNYAMRSFTEVSGLETWFKPQTGVPSSRLQSGRCLQLVLARRA
jgi:antibiotic biosynthesis monooxygenase (ABM) superfamily enzyme